MEVVPGANGLSFRKVISEYDRRIGLFYILDDSSINIPLQGIKMNFGSLGFDTTIVDEFREKIKTVLNGKLRAPINEINIEDFNTVIDEFSAKIDDLDISQ